MSARETGSVSLTQTGAYSEEIVIPSTHSSLTISLVATSWGTATAKLQYTLDLETWHDFDPAVTFSTSSNAEISVMVLGVTAVRVYTTAGDIASGSSAAIWTCTALGAYSTTNVTVSGGGGGAPTDATYIVQTANATLTNEQILASLATGLVKNTTATGVLSIGVAGTDYAAASHTHAYTDVISVPTDSVLGRDTAGTGAAESLSLDASLAFTAATTLGRAALTGDVTASAGGNATTIANNAVTYAKAQDVSAASRLIGRGSAAGAGDPQEMTVGSNLSISGTVVNLASSISVTDITSSGTLFGQTVLAAVGVAATIVTTDTVNEENADAGVTVDGVLLKDGLIQTANAVGTTAIAGDSVTYAKIQNVSAVSRLLGRGSAAGAGDTEEITLGTNLSMSGTTLNASGGGSGLTHPEVMARVSMGF